MKIASNLFTKCKKNANFTQVTLLDALLDYYNKQENILYLTFESLKVWREKSLESAENSISEHLNFACARGGGGALNKILYGEALPRGPTPYIFIYHF